MILMSQFTPMAGFATSQLSFPMLLVLSPLLPMGKLNWLKVKTSREASESGWQVTDQHANSSTALRWKNSLETPL